MLKQSVHQQFHRNNAKHVRSMLSTEFYKFKGLGVEGQKTLFNSRIFLYAETICGAEGADRFQLTFVPRALAAGCEPNQLRSLWSDFRIFHFTVPLCHVDFAAIGATFGV